MAAVAKPPGAAGMLFSPPASVPSPPHVLAEQQQSADDPDEGERPSKLQRRTQRAEGPTTFGMGLRIEIASPSPDSRRSPSPFRVPGRPQPLEAAAAAVGSTPASGAPAVADLRVVADMLPTVALQIMAHLDAASLTAAGLVSIRLNDLSEIAARRRVLRSKCGAGSRARINPAFNKFSARSRWKRLAHCTEIVENFASLACVNCPISAEQVLAYLGCHRVPSLRCAVAETERMVADRTDPMAQDARGVARFMAGWLVPALFDFLSARGRLFINCGHDSYSGLPTMKNQFGGQPQIDRVRAEAACPEGFAFSGTGLARRPTSPPATATAAGAAAPSRVELPSREALTLARLCVLKLFMPPWFGLEPLPTPRIRTARSITPTLPGMEGFPLPSGLPRAFGSVDGFTLPKSSGSMDGRIRSSGSDRRQGLPLPPASAEEKRLAANLLCGKCHPDEWLRVMTQAGIPTEASFAKLALPVCLGPKVLLGRVFDCSCFVMSGADSPVVSFLATASDGAQVTVRDAWLSIWQNMPWVSLGCCCCCFLAGRFGSCSLRAAASALASHFLGPACIALTSNCCARARSATTST